MKNKILSLVSCLAICLSLVLSVLPATVAEDAPITGVTAHAVGGCWEAGSYAVDGRMDTQWHTQMGGWGAMFFDLGKDYDLTQLRLQFPSGYFGDSGKIGTVRIDAVSRIPGKTDENGNIPVYAYSDVYDAYVTIVCDNATVDETGFCNIGNTRILVGSQIYFSSGYLNRIGYCTRFEIKSAG